MSGISMLAAALSLGRGESPISFASRLAIRCGCRSLVDFCRDMDINVRHIINATDETLMKLAELGGVSYAELSAFAFRKVDDLYSCGSQILNMPMLLRNQLCVCPLCVAGDIEQGAGIGTVAAFCRSEWQIKPIRTCSVHGVALVNVMTRERTKMSYLTFQDSCRHLIPALLDGKIQQALQVRGQTAFERYLHNRFHGISNVGTEWLDSFPFYAAVNCCEMVGALALRGSDVTYKELDDDESRDAGRIGFEILSEGAEGLVRFLGGIPMRDGDRRGAPKARALFGKLYLSLLSKNDPAYEPFREQLTNVTLSKIHMAPDEILLGKPVGKRHFHTILSASRESGVGTDRLRRLLCDANFISDEDAEKSNSRTLIPIDGRLNAFLADLSSALSTAQAADHLNMTRQQFQRMLSAGILHPLDADGAVTRKFTFPRKSLDDFLAGLLGKALDHTECTPDIMDIPTAARRLCCTSDKVVKLILQDKISRIYIDSKKSGFQAILVDLEEIKKIM